MQNINGSRRAGGTAGRQNLSGTLLDLYARLIISLAVCLQPAAKTCFTSPLIILLDLQHVCIGMEQGHLKGKRAKTRLDVTLVKSH